MSLINVNNISFKYPHTDKNVFENVSFNIDKKEIFCIVGANGCGKSTLIDCILGVNKISKGDILIASESIHKIKPNKMASVIAYVPQNHIKTFPYRVIDIVVMGKTYESRIFESPGSEEYKKAREALELVGLKGFEERDYTKISGGELQLVLIARALTQEAKVLIMDEPTAHLDFRHELNVLNIIAKLVKEKDISVVMATHFLNQGFFLESKKLNINVALMNNNGFEKIGPPSEILNEENLLVAFGINTKVATYQDEDLKRQFIIPIDNE